MRQYDPDVSPGTDEWLQLDESERLELVRAYHRGINVRVPNDELHSVIHTVVENQVALGQEGVVHALTRLQAEGLSRHDAIHAIGSVLAEHLYALMQEGSNKGDPAYVEYLEHLGKLTADSWRTG